MTRRAAVYVRISKDLAGSGLGVARQDDECRALADRLGWAVAGTYQDNDMSASTGRTRPAYARMLDDMTALRVDAVIAWHPDRLTRQPKELEHLIQLADEHGVVFSTCRAGELDLSTSSGRLVARLLGAVARHEAELKGERQAAQLRQRALAGLPSGGGSRPYGWADDRTRLDPGEAAVIRVCVDKVLAGETVGAVTDWLHTAGHRTVTGKPWHPTVVRRMLTAPRIAGIAQHRGTVVGAGQWEPVVDEPTWRRVRALLTHTGPARRNTGRVALLPGLIWCGRCGFELVTFQQSRPTGRTLRSYGCRTRYLPGRPGYRESCGGVTVQAEALEDDVAERVLARLTSAAGRRRLAQRESRLDRTAGVADEVAAAEETLADLGRDYGDGRIGRIEFLAARDRLAGRLDGLTRQLGTLAPAVPHGDPDRLAAWWAAATTSQRQTLLRQHVDRISIGPHRGRRSHYDPTRVTIRWR